jgi:GntR family transcriptional regulator/MocR family aminotransferase
MVGHDDMTRTRYREIYNRLRASIEDGKLQPGDRIPPARALAAELNVARGTVDTAYSLLAAEGFLITNRRAGTFVSPSMPELARNPPAGSGEGNPAEWDPEDFRYLFDAPLPLMPGLPSFDQFPRKLWSKTVARQVRKSGIMHITYPDPLGIPALRQALASYVAVARGIRCVPEQIIITGGYLGALGLICRAMLQPDARAWIEAPGYGFTRRAIQMMRAVPVPISVDDEGLDVAEGMRIAPDAALCVVAPSNQFPLGASLSLGRRAALLNWARRNESWIVEDDYAGEFRYEGWPLPALKSLDSGDRVFYVGTFSKTMFPGLRIGYLIVPDVMLDLFRNHVRRLEGGRAILEQAALAEFIANGYFGRHIKKMRGLYKTRKAALAAAMTNIFGDRFDMRPMAGGLHLVAHTGDFESDTDLEAAAAAAGLSPLALSKMGQGRRCPGGLLLGFANLPEDQAPLVVRRLERALWKRGSALPGFSDPSASFS